MLGIYSNYHVNIQIAQLVSEKYLSFTISENAFIKLEANHMVCPEVICISLFVI